jgi:type I restriction enzyme S subunit
LGLKSEINVKNKFLYYLVQSDKIIEAANISIGTKMPRAEWKTVSETLIPLPTLPEQTAIATALSDMDALITQTDRLIQKKKAIKQGLMQELLSPKEGWEVRKLGDAIKVSRGGSPRPIQNYLTSDPNGINWIKIGDTSPTSKYITSTNDKIIAEGVISSRQVFVGDFLLSNSMSFGRPYILKIDGCIHDGWLVLQDYQTIFNRDFLIIFLVQVMYSINIKNLAAGSSVLNLNKDIVEKVFLEKPASIEEQVEIASILSLPMPTTRYRH